MFTNPQGCLPTSLDSDDEKIHLEDKTIEQDSFWTITVEGQKGCEVKLKASVLREIHLLNIYHSEAQRLPTTASKHHIHLRRSDFTKGEIR